MKRSQSDQWMRAVLVTLSVAILATVASAGVVEIGGRVITYDGETGIDGVPNIQVWIKTSNQSGTINATTDYQGYWSREIDVPDGTVVTISPYENFEHLGELLIAEPEVTTRTIGTDVVNGIWFLVHPNIHGVLTHDDPDHSYPVASFEQVDVVYTSSNGVSVAGVIEAGGFFEVWIPTGLGATLDGTISFTDPGFEFDQNDLPVAMSGRAMEDLGYLEATIKVPVIDSCSLESTDVHVGVFLNSHDDRYPNEPNMVFSATGLGAFAADRIKVRSYHNLMIPDSGDVAMTKNGDVWEFAAPMPMGVCGDDVIIFEWGFPTIDGGMYFISTINGDYPSGYASVDIDFDGDVDLTDAGYFTAARGSTEGDPNYNRCCDFDSDGDIDLSDAGFFTDALLGGNKKIDGLPDLNPNTDQMFGTYPNPFNPSTTVKFSLAEPQRISCQVFDLRGRCIAELYDGVAPAGISEFEWRGQTTSGTAAPSGSYFFRVRGDHGLQLQTKAVLLK